MVVCFRFASVVNQMHRNKKPPSSTPATTISPAATTTTTTPATTAAAAAPAEEPKPAGLSSQALQAEIQHLREMLEEAKQNRAELQDTIKTLQRELHTANDQLAAEKKLRDTESKKFESDKAKLIKDHERAIEKLTTQHQKDIATLEDKVEELKEDVEMAGMDRDLAEEKLRDCEAEKEQLLGKVEILEATQAQVAQADQGEDVDAKRMCLLAR
jgi:chromosome segregation ATPase